MIIQYKSYILEFKYNKYVYNKERHHDAFCV